MHRDGEYPPGINLAHEASSVKETVGKECSLKVTEIHTMTKLGLKAFHVVYMGLFHLIYTSPVLCASENPVVDSRWLKRVFIW